MRASAHAVRPRRGGPGALLAVGLLSILAGNLAELPAVVLPAGTVGSPSLGR